MLNSLKSQCTRPSAARRPTSSISLPYTTPGLCSSRICGRTKGAVGKLWLTSALTSAPSSGCWDGKSRVAGYNHDVTYDMIRGRSWGRDRHHCRLQAEKAGRWPLEERGVAALLTV